MADEDLEAIRAKRMAQLQAVSNRNKILNKNNGWNIEIKIGDNTDKGLI